MINEGRDFQADIPPLQQRQDVNYDSHNAQLLWTVQDHLEHPDTQLRSKLIMCTKQYQSVCALFSDCFPLVKLKLCL